MKKRIRNIAAAVIAVLMIGAMAGTAYLTESEAPQMGQVRISDQQGGQMQEPPEKSDGESEQMQEPPEKPDGESEQMQEPAAMGQSGIGTKAYILFGVEGFILFLSCMYLLIGIMDKKKQVAFMVVIALLAGCGSAFAVPQLAEKSAWKEDDPQESQKDEAVEAKGIVEIDGTEENVDGENVSTSEDENVVLVKNGGKAEITGKIRKESGDASNTSESDFSGVNAGILVQENSQAEITDAEIVTEAKGANAVFSTGSDSKIVIKDSVIKTSGEASARGLDATYGGTIEAENVSIETKGGSCAALATDRGEGTVSARDSELITSGAGSPVIYSTGTISIERCRGIANGAQITVVEGKNTATVSDSEVSASGAGNRGDVDMAGIMIYQSMSGDAEEGAGTFTGSDSKLSIQKDSEVFGTAPFFFVTNTDAVINLKNCDIDYGSDVLLKAEGTSEWGKEGENGGTVELNGEEQSLSGNIILDKLSSVHMNLKNQSSYIGTINGENTAEEVAVKLSKDSKLVLTGDSYITSLENEDTQNSNIDFNGHTLYVSGEAI